MRYCMSLHSVKIVYFMLFVLCGIHAFATQTDSITQDFTESKNFVATKNTTLQSYIEQLKQLDMALHKTESIWLKTYENFKSPA